MFGHWSFLGPIALAAALVAGTATGATSPTVRLAAVELEPEDPSPGGQFVWLTNSSRATVDIGCWRLRSHRATLWIEPPLRLGPRVSATLAPDRAWLQASDRVQLIGRSGRLVDTTPGLTDRSYDDQIWFRTAAGRWRFGRTRLTGEVMPGRLLGRKPMRC